MSQDWTAIEAIRFLGVDAVNHANSGHPGIVIGAAPMLHVLFTKHLKVNTKNSKWFNRDRFILSAGHGSALLYAVNHLAGYKISIDDLKQFRNNGITPGHPEFGHTDGVETTSGPLGQGISNAVGMAIAEVHLAARFNTAELPLVDHFTYVLCGDGDLQEGVTLESISLAGHLGLGKLIVLFDSNDIQLDGETKYTVSEDLKKKMESQGWQYLLVEDGEDLVAIDKAIKKAKKNLNKPTIIEIKTIIGKGTNVAGTSKAHGSPIGMEEAVRLRKETGWNYDPFVVPQEAYDVYQSTVIKRGKREISKWKKVLKRYQHELPEQGKLFESFLKGDIDIDFSHIKYEAGSKEATRNVLGKALDVLSEKNLNVMGGSADLSGSTKAKGADGHFTATNYLARNINFGVREHAMGAITNGIVLHGGLKAFSGGFFVFLDYMRPPVRLAALMQIPSVFIFSHDSVAVGEDGPTHQPVEHLVSIRSIPDLNVIRPADANETLAAVDIAFSSKKRPTVIITSRQNVLNLAGTHKEGVKKGAYIIAKEESKLDGILLASGSEVGLAFETQGVLKEKGIDVRVVSMPSHYAFELQDKAYQDKILPADVPTMAIELGSSYSWYKYTKHIYGVDTFGISAPLKTVLEHFKFNKDAIAQKFMEIIK